AALRGDLLAAAARVLDWSRFVLGEEGKALEAALAARHGVRHAVGVASGTDALRLALAALGVGPGDEVLTPAFSFVASATTIVMVGARPVFVDIDPETYALDVAAAERALTPPTRLRWTASRPSRGRTGSPSSRTPPRPSARRGRESRSAPGATRRACPSTRRRTSARAETRAWSSPTATTSRRDSPVCATTAT